MQFTMGRAVMEQSCLLRAGDVLCFIIGQRIAPNMTSRTKFSYRYFMVFFLFDIISFRALREISSPRNPATNSCVPIIMEVNER